MGFWAGIKHALNSTLGTEEFKSLDKIINDLIVGQIRMTASDNLYSTGGNYKLTLNPEESISRDVLVYNMTKNGSVRLKGTVTRSSRLIGYTVNVYKNSTTLVFSHGGISDTSLEYEYSCDVSFVPGDIITLQILAANEDTVNKQSVSIRNYFYGDAMHSFFYKI